MRFYVIFIISLSLLSCSHTSSISYEPVCFDTEDEARKVGNRIFDEGFNNRVSYWVTGDTNTPIPTLGLLWAGFNPQSYCSAGGYPILITFDSKDSPYDSENVLRWAKIVLKKMIREQAIET